MKITGMSSPPEPPLPRDVVEAIGEPSERRSWPSEEETGWEMKLRARAAVDRGEIRTEADARRRFEACAGWIASLDGKISDEAQACWMRMEEQFFRSARKYLHELKEGKTADEV